MNLYPLARVVAPPAMHIAFRLKFEGLENLPQEGGYILAANHRSYIDPVILSIPIHRKLNYVAKDSLFKNKLFGWLIRSLGAFPINRNIVDGSALGYAEELLKKGENVVIFPEGTRSKTGKPGRAKAGAVLVACSIGAKIVPVGITAPKKIGFRSKIIIRFGEPIDPASFGVEGRSAAALRAASGMMMEKIVALLDEEAR